MPINIILFFISAFGALFGYWFEINIYYSLYGILFILLIFLLTIKYRINIIVAVVFIFFISIFLSSLDKHQYNDKLSKLPQGEVVYEGIVADISPFISKGKKFLFNINGYINKDKIINEQFKIQVFLRDGAAAKQVEPGDLIRIKAKAYRPKRALYPADFDSYKFGLARKVHGNINIYHPNKILLIKKQHKKLIFAQLKYQLTNRLLNLVTPTQSGLILALIVGETTLFEDIQKRIYGDIGAGHLLAVSGLQVSLLVFLFFSLLEVLFASLPFISLQIYARKISIILSLIMIWIFVALCFMAPSAVRAALMASISLGSMILLRNMSLLNALGLAGFLTVLLSPASVMDVSFLLSYAAMIGLFASGSKVDQLANEDLFEEEQSSAKIAFYKIMSKIKIIIFATFAASLCTFPITVYTFGQFAPSSIVANAFLVPIATLLQAPSIIFGLLAAFFNSAILAQIASFFAGLIECLCMGFAFMAKTINVSPPRGHITILFFFAAICIILAIKGVHRFRYASVAVVFLLISCIPLLDFSANTKVTFLAVGQGDSIFIQTASKHNILVDGGGSWKRNFDPGEKIILPYLTRLGIKHLDIVVVSHPDHDHIIGLLSVIDNISVGEIWHSGFSRSNPLINELYQLAEKHNIAVKTTKNILGTHNFGDTILQVLAPKPQNQDEMYYELSNNNNSLVMLLEHKNKKVLLTGDMEEEAERLILRDNYNLSADILKAAHHGSSTSSSQQFIEQVKPKHVVFCTSRPNQWHFPNAQVVKRFKSVNAQLWDTGYHGQITFILRQQKVEVLPFQKGSCCDDK